MSSVNIRVSSYGPKRALPWPQPPSTGDTTWFAAIDGKGCAVSVIQSLYFEFGSGVVLPRTGIVWQNRGASFRLAADGWNALKPRRKPFHTLNPALARFDDGRRMLPAGEIHFRPSRPRPFVCDSAKTTPPSFTPSRASFSTTSLVEVVS